MISEELNFMNKMLQNGLHDLEIVAVEELTPYEGRPVADDIPSIAVVS